jgi:hypothetical protein
MIKLKTVGANSIGMVIVAVLAIVYSLLTGDATLLGRLVETTLAETATAPQGDYKEDEIITLRIANDGDVIRHGGDIRLNGDIHFTGKAGDLIVLQRRDGVWTEIGRHLVEED